MTNRSRRAEARTPWILSALLAAIAVVAIVGGLHTAGTKVDDRKADNTVAAPAEPPVVAPSRHNTSDATASVQHAFTKKYRTEQLEILAKLLALHPPLRPAEAAENTAQVEVIAVDRGGPPPAAASEPADYQAYRSDALAARELIALHITRQDPFYLVLLSDGPVIYDLQTQVSSALRGVLIASPQPSTIEGLPSEIPLEILAAEAGLVPSFRRPSTRDEQAALEQDLRDMFPSQEIAIRSHGAAPVILVR